MSVRGSLLRGELAVGGNRIVSSAVASWRRGSPVWELPLLNHLTGRLGEKQRRTLEIHGTGFEVTTRVSDFHQQDAENSRDLYGADLALAVHLAEPSVVKYALFQLKVPGKREKLVLLDKDQLSAALDPDVDDRTFVVAVDREAGEVRVRSVRALYDEFDHATQKKRFDFEHWDTLEEWTHQWLLCHIGRESPDLRPGGYPPGSLERRIGVREFFTPVREDELAVSYRRELDHSPDRPIPARAFVRIYVTPVRYEEV